MIKINKDLKDFYMLWASQALSQLGSSITSFALTIWLYEKTGSSLNTATLSICTYAPYVLMSVFAGALSDKFDKKITMLVCDLLAALSTVCVLWLYKNNLLAGWHLYLINIIAGLMNTVQQPASEVALTLIVNKKYYQETSALKNLSRSVISILNPLIATALYGLAGLDLVIACDLGSFVIAFTILLIMIQIPKVETTTSDNFITMVKEGFTFLKKTPLIFDIIFFMSSVNLIASAFDAVLPGLVIPLAGSDILGIVTSCAGVAMVIGSVIVARLPKPKDRVKVVYYTMLFSFASENLLISISRSPIVWCIGQFLGWVVVPIMSTNLEVVIRNSVPIELQGRVYACRNTLQYFTIPIGLFLGGWFVDNIAEAYMAKMVNSGLLTTLFGMGKGSGAALTMFILWLLGTLLCFINGQKLKKYHYHEE